MIFAHCGLGWFAPPAEPRLRAVWAALWGCVTVAWILYLPTLDHSYFADDHIYLGFGTSKLINLPPSAFLQIFTERMNPWEYLPLRDLTYWIDIQLLGGFPDGFHFSNIVWYVACCAAVAYFVTHLLRWTFTDIERDQARIIMALVVAVFAVHPAHVEPVAWIAGRKDILAGMFMMVALGAFVRGLDRGYRWSDLMLACLSLAAALLCKGAVVGSALLFPILAAAGWRPGAPPRLVRAALFVLLPLVVAGALTWLHSAIGAESGIRAENHVGIVVVLERASRIWATLLGIILAPTDLRLIYDVYAGSNLHWLVSVVTIAGCVAAATLLARGRRSLSTIGGLFAVCGTLPYLQIVPFSTWSMASERFVFVPVLGGALMFGSLVLAVWRQQWGKFVVFGLVPAVLAGGLLQSYARVLEWESSSSLAASQYVRNQTYFGSVRLYFQIMFPKELDYAEAAGAIGRVEDAHARHLLQEWLEVRNAYYSNRSFIDPGKLVVSEPYCRLAPVLVANLDQQAQYATYEQDLAYSSMVRGLRRDLEVSLPRIERVCTS